MYACLPVDVVFNLFVDDFVSPVNRLNEIRTIILSSDRLYRIRRFFFGSILTGNVYAKRFRFSLGRRGNGNSWSFGKSTNDFVFYKNEFGPTSTTSVEGKSARISDLFFREIRTGGGRQIDELRETFTVDAVRPTEISTVSRRPFFSAIFFRLMLRWHDVDH